MLHDILTLSGSVSLGKHGRSRRDSKDGVQQETGHGGLLLPLRRLLHDPVEAIGTAYSAFGGRLPDGTLDSSQSDDFHIQALSSRLTQARTYHDWLSAATELDEIEGKDAWKQEEESQEYDTGLVKSRLQQMEETRSSGDQGRTLLLVRTALTRNLGGMGNLRLYKHSRVGTKALIERYIQCVLDTIQTLVDTSRSPARGKLERQRVLSDLVFTRQSFGRSALLLSGGGTFGMNHIGVVKALFEAQLLPRIISGASAGSIVCSVLCTKTDAEIPDVLKEFCYGDLAVFEKEGDPESVLRKAFRFLTKGALFDISNLVRVMRDILGDMTFQEAYNRTRRILNICVSTASLYELPRLLNYVTAPNVMIWSAVAASCSVPFIFSAAQLLAKDPRTGQQVPWNQTPQRWIDGSVENDLPMTRLSEMFNVNHFIVSQVNPHVVPFLERNEDDITAEAQQSSASHVAGPGWLQTLTNLAKSEALHRMQVLTEMGVLPNTLSKVRSVLGQRYSGDITIFPRISYANFPLVLTNPTTDFMVEAMLSGEQATWPKLSEIRNHCAIELALDDAVHKMMTQVAFSPSQVDLRRLTAFEQFQSSSQPKRKQRNHYRRGSYQPVRTSLEKPRLDIPRADHGRKSVCFDSDICIAAPASTKIPGTDMDEFSSEPESLHSSLNHTSFDSDDEVSTSDSYDESPPSPLPRLWPSTRQLFPSSSQPTTPSARMRSRSFSIPMPSATGLAMTPAATRPSTPEMLYKRLFGGFKADVEQSVHPIAAGWDGARRSTDEGTAQQNTEVDEGSWSRRRRRGSLDVDISGTKGMLRRRKRSLSIGLRNLRRSSTQR